METEHSNHVLWTVTTYDGNLVTQQATYNNTISQDSVAGDGIGLEVKRDINPSPFLCSYVLSVNVRYCSLCLQPSQDHSKLLLEQHSSDWNDFYSL